MNESVDVYRKEITTTQPFPAVVWPQAGLLPLNCTSLETPLSFASYTAPCFLGGKDPFGTKVLEWMKQIMGHPLSPTCARAFGQPSIRSKHTDCATCWRNSYAHLLSGLGFTNRNGHTHFNAEGEG